MHREYRLPITAITGPATDNEVGQVYITAQLGLAAHNALRDAAGLTQAVRVAIDAWTARASDGAADASAPAPLAGSLA
jgi:hypothetical protein